MAKYELKNYESNKKKARELFKKAIEIKYNSEGLAMFQLHSKLNQIIMEMNALGYVTTIENIGYRSEGGKVWEMDNLKLLHAFTEVLGIKTTSLGYADYHTVYNRLANMDLGLTCRACGGSGRYTLASGAKASCARCAGTGKEIEIDESLLEDVAEMV